MVYRGHMLFYKKNYGGFWTVILRLMMAMLSLIKLLIWGTAYLIPEWRNRAQKELRSNADVVRLCWNLA